MKSSILNEIGIDPAYIILGMGGIIIILFILIIIQMVKVSKLKKRYNKFMEGQDAKSMENAFLDKFKEIDHVSEKIIEHTNQINEINEFTKLSYSKIGIVKYDAFKEMGGNMSFSLALLNDKNNGFLMNSMHSREGCYTYIKEIVKGESYIVLGEEEKEALRQAVNMYVE